MIRDPSADEILAAVARWLEQRAAAPSSRDAYFTRVAENALGIVRRELAAASTLMSDEESAALSRGLRDGTLDPQTPGLIAKLKDAIKKQIAIDQPNYRSLPPR